MENRIPVSTPELDYITIKGFKSIASVEKLRLGSINLLISPNGSGKSNFIGVFSFLHKIREGHLNDYVRKAGGAEQLLHFGSKVTDEILIKISFCQEVNQYELTLEPAEDDSLYLSSEAAYFWKRKNIVSQAGNHCILVKTVQKRGSAILDSKKQPIGFGSVWAAGGFTMSMIYQQHIPLEKDPQDKRQRAPSARWFQSARVSLSDAQ